MWVVLLTPCNQMLTSAVANKWTHGPILTCIGARPVLHPNTSLVAAGAHQGKEIFVHLTVSYRRGRRLRQFPSVSQVSLGTNSPSHFLCGWSIMSAYQNVSGLYLIMFLLIFKIFEIDIETITWLDHNVSCMIIIWINSKPFWFLSWKC